MLIDVGGNEIFCRTSEKCKKKEDFAVFAYEKLIGHGGIRCKLTEFLDGVHKVD